MKFNPVQNLVKARLSALMAQYQAAESTHHMATRGQLREKYLIDFFKDVIPKKFSISSGIICDASGETSHQLDFIVVDEEFLPAMGMHDGVAIVPVETAILSAEIKTTLTQKALDQVAQQNVGLSKLRYTDRKISEELGVSTDNVIIPTIIFAFNSEVSVDRLKKWFGNNPNTISCCIINQYSILKRGAEDFNIVENGPDVPDFWETLVFIGKLYHALLDISSMRPIRPNWDQYMQGYTLES